MRVFSVIIKYNVTMAFKVITNYRSERTFADESTNHRNYIFKPPLYGYFADSKYKIQSKILWISDDSSISMLINKGKKRDIHDINTYELDDTKNKRKLSDILRNCEYGQV